MIAMTTKLKYKTNGKSAMLVGCGYKDELKYMATLVVGFTPLRTIKNSEPDC